MQFGPQNIIWGLKNGGWRSRAPGAPLDPLLNPVVFRGGGGGGIRAATPSRLKLPNPDKYCTTSRTSFHSNKHVQYIFARIR